MKANAVYLNCIFKLAYLRIHEYSIKTSDLTKKKLYEIRKQKKVQI